MNRYEKRIHIGCGGDLHFEKEETKPVVINQRDVDRFGAKAKIIQRTKHLYRCDKCNDLVNIIICPSWEEYVLRGQIRVPYYILKAIKDRHASIKR